MKEYTIQTEFASVISMDQHARFIMLSALDLTTGKEAYARLNDCPRAEDVIKWATTRLTEPMRFVYESGPCVVQLARDLRNLGYSCDVIAVSSIPVSVEDRIHKDDRRDEDRLLAAVLNPKTKCRVTWIPDEESEAARDLVRSYYDIVNAVKRSKLQCSSMLLRHGYVWDQRTKTGKLKATWTENYISWVKSIELPKPVERRTLQFYLETVLIGLRQCSDISKECIKVCSLPRFKPYVDALTRLKGVDEITALAYVATMDDFTRFKNGYSVSRYFGLTPSRNDSGEKTGKNGHITKAGDTTVRKAVIEGLASLSQQNRIPKILRSGHEISAEVEEEARKCNIRHYKRFRHLISKGKKINVAKVAVASEMVRDMWAIGLIVHREISSM
ncbi:MAG TPA: IS110 family transposase [Clostridiaceae bacterium]|jgi:transposase|nr:IS110 family transposase [Clostridiaceae bacterium]